MKKFIIAFTLVFATTISSYTQESQDGPFGSTNFTQSLRLYLDASTGQLVPDQVAEFNAASILKDNCAEVGFEYSQNFNQAWWLTVGFNAYVTPYLNVMHSTIDQEVYLSSSSGVGIKGANAAMFARFYNIAQIKVDANLRIIPSLFYTLHLPVNQSILFLSELQVNTLPRKDTTADTGVYQDRYIEEFQVRLAYNIGFAEGWRYTSDLRFYFTGYGENNRQGGTVVSDSAEAFMNSFRIRWSNEIAYAHSSGWDVYANVRYQVENLTHNRLGVDMSISKIDRVSLQAGMSYTFDFANQ